MLEVGRVCATSQRRLVHLVAALDRSGEWVLDGSSTCAHWVADALDVEVSTAREWLRIGRKLQTHQLIDDAFADGRLSYTKVRTLSRVVTEQNEAELCALGERTRAGFLPRAVAAWLLGHEEPEETEKRQREARSLNWRVDPDGMVVGWFRLPPAMAAILMVAIEAWIMRFRPRAGMSTQSDDDASVGAFSPPSVVEWPSVSQQRADALIDLINGGGVTIDTEVIVHVRADGCTLDDGTPIAGSIVERIAPESFLRALIHDAESHPINASGRQRHPYDRQKRVVHERDRACIDCGATEFLDYDHVPGFEKSKRTLVDELKLRCWTCHRARHERERGGGGSS